MKIKEAIRLLSKQDPEADLCVYNHEFDSWADAKMLLRTEDGKFMFSDEAVTYLDDARTPTEVTEDMLHEATNHVEYCAREIERAKRQGSILGIEAYEIGLEKARARLEQLRALAAANK